MDLLAAESLAQSPGTAIDVPEYETNEVVDAIQDYVSGRQSGDNLDSAGAGWELDSLPVQVNDADPVGDDGMPPDILEAWNDVMAAEPGTLSELAPEQDSLPLYFEPSSPPASSAFPAQPACQACPARQNFTVPIRTFSTQKFLEKHCNTMRTLDPRDQFVTLKHAPSELTLAAVRYMLRWMDHSDLSAAHQVFKRLREPPGAVAPLKWSTPRRVTTNDTMLRYMQPELKKALAESGNIRTPSQLLAHWQRTPTMDVLHLPHIIYLIVYMVFLTDERRRGETEARANRNAKRRSRDILERCVYPAALQRQSQTPRPVKRRPIQRGLLTRDNKYD